MERLTIKDMIFHQHFDKSVFLAKLALCMCTVSTRVSQYNSLSIALPQILKYIWYEVYSEKKKPSCTIYIWKKIIKKIRPTVLINVSF